MYQTLQEEILAPTDDAAVSAEQNLYAVTAAVDELADEAAYRSVPEVADSDGLGRPCGREAETTDLWCVPAQLVDGRRTSVGQLFFEQLLDNVDDAVIFVDAQRQIQVWNRAAEAVIGRASETMRQQRWNPALFELRDEHFKLVSADRCPVARTLHTGLFSRQRMFVTNSQQEKVSVELLSVPLLGPDGALHGVTLLIRDASSQFDLEEQVQTLHEQVALDGLTKVANRAEFDRRHKELVHTHLANRRPYSLVISDIDHFKQINDTYGHPAGDEALIEFAALLKQHCREDDTVARYGGEEFVLLCPDCTAETAANRTEKIRRLLEHQPQPALGGKCMTASFGVTELGPGEKPEAMLARADRALLQAKTDGRNRVVLLGGNSQKRAPQASGGWLSWLTGRNDEPLLQVQMASGVPLKLALEKLRGFAVDHRAEGRLLDDHRAIFHVDSRHALPMRRNGDRSATFTVEVSLEERSFEYRAHARGSAQWTVIDVSIRPRRRRDRQQPDVKQRAQALVMLLRAYLMAQDLPAAE